MSIPNLAVTSSIELAAEVERSNSAARARRRREENNAVKGIVIGTTARILNLMPRSTVDQTPHVFRASPSPNHPDGCVQCNYPRIHSVHGYPT